jgi:peptidoglycan hydrolase-like protein with peptidoglycan-binding domain
MNKKMVSAIVVLLFIFGFVSFSFALQQSVIMDYQKKLKTLGYYTGEPHGKLDEATIEAIKACQKACGVPVTGKMDKGTCAVIDKALKEKEQPMKEKKAE